MALRSSHGAAASAVALAVLGITMIALGQCRAAARGPHALRRGSLSRALLRGAACPGDGLTPGSCAYCRSQQRVAG